VIVAFHSFALARRLSPGGSILTLRDWLGESFRACHKAEIEQTPGCDVGDYLRPAPFGPHSSQFATR